ncbi:hypothetical protein Hdeb2414_s0009g00307901 [Helianthus debilis subsp. tardiflorus]
MSMPMQPLFETIVRTPSSLHTHLCTAIVPVRSKVALSESYKGTDNLDTVNRQSFSAIYTNMICDPSFLRLYQNIEPTDDEGGTSCMPLIIGCSLEAFISLKIGGTYAWRGEHTQSPG